MTIDRLATFSCIQHEADRLAQRFRLVLKGMDLDTSWAMYDDQMPEPIRESAEVLHGIFHAMQIIGETPNGYINAEALDHVG